MKSIYMDEKWGLLQQDKEKGEAMTFTAEKDGIKVVYPFIKRKAGIVDGIQYYDIVTPRGECGIWIDNPGSENETEAVKVFEEEFSSFCGEEHIIAEYIRFSPWANHFKSFSGKYDTRLYGHIYCNDLTCDFFNTEYSPAKRRNVRKAEKNGVEIVFDTVCESVTDFLSLYEYTAAKYDISPYYRIDESFLRKYCEMFPEETVFARAVYQGETISAALLVFGEDIGHYHFAASHPEFTSLQANSLLIYKASLHAAEKGKKLFDLGGATPGSRLEEYKQRIAKGFPCYLGTKIRNNEAYDKLVDKAGGPREGYFPSYRRD